MAARDDKLLAVILGVAMAVYWLVLTALVVGTMVWVLNRVLERLV